MTAKLAALGLFLGVGWAATLTVNTTSDDYQGVGGNTLCSLREALNSAQENRDIGGCERVRSGDYRETDFITLEAKTYKLTRGDGDSLLDQDKTNLNILGQTVVVEGTSSAETTITRDSSERFNLFEVNSGAILTLKKLKLSGGRVAGSGVSRNSLFVPPSQTTGGAIENRGTVLLDGVVVEGNSASDGGGISNIGSLTVRNSRIEANTADEGGGIASVGSLTIENSTITRNTGKKGGGLHIEEGSFNISNSLISFNLEAVSGGGLYITSGSGQIRHSTISSNSAKGDGGGIYRKSSGSSVRLLNVTITDNTADADRDGDNNGGGIFVESGGAMQIQNSLIAGNLDLSISQALVDCSGTLESLGNNLLGDSSGCLGLTGNDLVGTSASPIDPLLDPLSGNGGSTQSHALRSGSRAMDRGNNSACGSTDQRGQTRPTDGDGNGSANCDIGAFEASTLSTDLVVALVQPTNPLTAGQTFNLNFSVSNRSGNRATAAKVVLDVSLDPRLDTLRPFFPPSVCTRLPNLSVSCELGNIPANTTFNYFVPFSAGFSPGSKTANIAVSSATAESAPANNSNSIGFNIQPASGQASLAISGPSTAELEENLTYNLTARNLGPATIGFTSITMALPLGTAFVADQSSGCRINSTNTIICFKSNLAPNTEFAPRVVLRAPNTPTALRLLASMSVNIADSNLADNSAEVTTQIVAPQADLELKLVAPPLVQIRKEFVLRLDAKNLGTGLARGVNSSFSIPSFLTVQNDTSDECTVVVSQVRCDFGTVAAGATSSRFVQFSTGIDPRNYTFEANLGATVTDPNPTNNTATIRVTSQTAAPPTGTGANLSISASAQSQVFTTLEFSFSPFLDNDGPDPSTLPGLSFNLPSGITYVSGPSDCSVSGGRVSCNLSSLAPFSGRAFQMTLRAPSTPGTIPIALNTTQTTPDPNPANNSFSKSVIVQQRPAGADLEVQGGAGQTVAAGGALRYTYTLSNKGPDTAPGALLQSALPEGASFVGASSGCALNESLMLCDLGTLGVGESRSVEFRLNAPASPGLFLVAASALSSRVEWNPGDNQATILTSVGGASGSLSAAKGAASPDSPKASPGRQDNAALQLTLSAGLEAMQVQSLGFGVSGSGNDAQDITALKLVLDGNANGKLDGGELVLASGKFTTDNGSTSLVLDSPLEVPAGQSQNLLVVLDFSATLALLGVPLLVLGLISWRRQRWATVLWVALALLAACTPAAPGKTYTLSLNSLQAKGSLTQQNAAPTGLPIQAQPMEVRP